MNRVTVGGLLRFILTVKQKTNKRHLMQSSKSDVTRSTGAQYSRWPRLIEIMNKKKKILD